MKFINDTVDKCVEDHAKEIEKANNSLYARLSTILERATVKVTNTKRAIVELEGVQKEAEDVAEQATKEISKILEVK